MDTRGSSRSAVVVMLLAVGLTGLSCNCVPAEPGPDGGGVADGGSECPAERSSITVTESKRVFEGTTTATAPGLFRIDGTSGQTLSGTLPTDSSGNYSIELPLFCGVQTVELSWPEPGPGCFPRHVFTVDRQQCVTPDLRVSLTWDAQGLDFELHLVKPGGRINDDPTDCTWTSCISSSPDWGVLGVAADDPHKDVDNISHYGPENIYLSGLETGVYTVFVEHWGLGTAAADGAVTITLRDTAPVVIQIVDLPSHFVRTVAQIEWASRTVTPLTTVVDCTGNWSSGCRAAIP